jgi:Rrf2 family protein
MLSNKAKYGFKAMFALGRLGPGELLSSWDIAREENIPKKFLDLILLELRQQGFVRSVRGQKGGYALAKAADKITLGNIMRAIDGPLAPIACASVTAYRRCRDCENEAECLVRKSMRRVRDAASDVLDQSTLKSSLSKSRAATVRRPRSAIL